MHAERGDRPDQTDRHRDIQTDRDPDTRKGKEVPRGRNLHYAVTQLPPEQPTSHSTQTLTVSHTQTHTYIVDCASLASADIHSRLVSRLRRLTLTKPSLSFLPLSLLFLRSQGPQGSKTQILPIQPPLLSAFPSSPERPHVNQFTSPSVFPQTQAESKTAPKSSHHVSPPAVPPFNRISLIAESPSRELGDLKLSHFPIPPHHSSSSIRER